MPRSVRKSVEYEEETRNTILRVARQLFMEHGYRAVSTRQIADHCGLTQPALYHHFSNKEDLYVAVMRSNLEETQAALERIVRRNENIENRLKRVARYLLSNPERDHTMMVHDIRMEISQTARTLLNAAFEAGIIAPIRSLLAEGVRDGTLLDTQVSGIDVTTATFLFISMLTLFLQRSSNASSVEEERAENIVVQLFLHGFATSLNNQSKI